MRYGLLAMIINLLPIIASGFLVLYLFFHARKLTKGGSERFELLHIAFTVILYAGLQIIWMMPDYEYSAFMEIMWALTETSLVIDIILIIRRSLKKGSDGNK